MNTHGGWGRSIAAVCCAGSVLLQFEKHAPIVSYGTHADDLFATVRLSTMASVLRFKNLTLAASFRPRGCARERSR